jgi:excisionase family DNA binding protein
MTLVDKLATRSSALKVKELADLLKVTPQHIYKLISLGDLPSVRIAGAIRVDPAEIVDWLKAQRPKYKSVPGRKIA